MSVAVAEPNLEAPLLFDLARGGFIDPREVPTNELFHGVQSISCPCTSIRVVQGESVSVIPEEGTDRTPIELPIGMVATLHYGSGANQRSGTFYVTADKSMAPFDPNYPPDEVAFREAARIDTAAQVFFADQDAPVRVVNDPAQVILDSAWSPVDRIYEPTNVTTGRSQEHTLTVDDAVELRIRLAGNPVTELVGKSAVGALSEVEFAEYLQVEAAQNLQEQTTAEQPGLGALLAGIVDEAKMNLQREVPGGTMQDRARQGYTSGANNNFYADLPKRKPGLGFRKKLAARIVALASKFPLPKARAGRHRADSRGIRSAGRHRPLPAF